MALQPLYSKQLSMLGQSLKVCPKRVDGDRRAVVACIVRKPRLGGQDSPLEMFFILRALDPNGSRWSGQVAFPGGHVEEGETDEDAVRRECKEEVGFDLNKTCRFLGETRPRVVQRNGGNLVVCCHVYEMVKEENPVGQISEIGACGWTPVHVLLDDKHTEPLNWSGLMAGSEGNCNVSPQWDHFPSVQLVFQDEAKDLFVVDTEQLDVVTAKKRFKLWGLTLSIVNDILLDSGLRSSPIKLQKANRKHNMDSSQL